jgi:hypothetical protein
VSSGNIVAKFGKLRHSHPARRAASSDSNGL